MAVTVDHHQTNLAIYREWLESLPTAGLVVIPDELSGAKKYSVRIMAWLDEANPTEPTDITPNANKQHHHTKTMKAWPDEADPREPPDVNAHTTNNQPHALKTWLDEWDPNEPTGTGPNAAKHHHHKPHAIKVWADEADPTEPPTSQSRGQPTGPLIKPVQPTIPGSAPPKGT